tara:strand:- start:1565 stop:1714 length:150 start_codon:yes stop_codon:yes gene_type:complete
MNMVDRDFSKMEETLKRPVKECFTYLSYMKDYNKEMEKENKRQEMKNKR